MATIRFDWDDNKSKSNKSKHGVSFEEAKTVFHDENALLVAEPDHSAQEKRFVLLGLARPIESCLTYIVTSKMTNSSE